ncbi:hypothetical protein G432_18395 [Sphingomonas sp. MM-1]|uniref:hypothetical protein n=1 Tax=Sphingomonas sp. MM-1 TaxID=745310 RepID=UPI0002C13242|nr:hypothetical protein [Sphingomonas sp. MM-1]AGH51397.1 hypothetical protein G432_18395 [Sphingomonas sp. MM-1]
MTVSAACIHQLKRELLADCHRIADDLGCDLEGEMIRRDLCSPRQASFAMQGDVPRVSLARLLDFTMELREAVWDRLAGMVDDYEPDHGAYDGDDDDGIPF